MGSNSETGNAINIGNFRTLISEVSRLGGGGKYNPSNPKLSLVAMTTKCDEVSALQTAYIEVYEELRSARNRRRDLFDKISGLVTRTYNYYAGLATNEGNKRTLKGLAAVIKGTNAKRERLADGRLDPAHISKSHLGFDTRLLNFEQYIGFLEYDPLYTPSETALQTTTLRAFLLELKDAHDKADKKAADVAVKRIARDEGMYDLKTGLIDIALDCKKYVRAVFGAKSQEAVAVGRIRFRRVMEVEKVG